MKKLKLKINSITTLTDFVNKASKVDGDVLVLREKYIVDGASLLGVMSIDTSRGVEIQYPDTATEFENYLKKLGAE